MSPRGSDSPPERRDRDGCDVAHRALLGGRPVAHGARSRTETSVSRRTDAHRGRCLGPRAVAASNPASHITMLAAVGGSVARCARIVIGAPTAEAGVNHSPNVAHVDVLISCVLCCRHSECIDARAARPAAHGASGAEPILCRSCTRRWSRLRRRTPEPHRRGR